MFMLVSRRYERASADRHLQQAVLRLGRDLRRRHGRHRDGRPAHPPRRDPQPQRRQLPPQRPRPRPPPHPPRRPIALTPPRAARRRHFAPLAYGSLRETPPLSQTPSDPEFNRREHQGGSNFNRRPKRVNFQPRKGVRIRAALTTATIPIGGPVFDARLAAIVQPVIERPRLSDSRPHSPYWRLRP